MKRNIIVGCSLLLLIGLFASTPRYSAQDENASAGYVGGAGGGGMGEGAAARDVVLSDLPQVTTQAVSAHLTHLRPLNGLTDEQYAALKASAARGGTRGSGTAVPAGGSKSGIEAVGASVGFTAQQEVCCTPPDMALAVGSKYVVEFINTYIAVYDKVGNLQSGYPKDADTFFGLASGTYTTDPRAFYDWTNNRYVIVMLTESSPFSGSSNVGGLLVAASATSDPRGSWHVYSPAINIGSAGQCPDYPTLGHDSVNWGKHATKGGFYVGINLFSGTGNCQGAGFNTNYVFFFPKDAFYSGAGFGYWYFFGLFANGSTVDTLQPANVTNSSDKPDAIFLINSYNINFGGGVCSSGCNGLVVWTVSGPSATPNNPFAFLNGGSGPTLTGVTIGTTHNYSLPPNADEPNGSGGVCSFCVDTNDTRISGQVKYAAGSLWGSLNTKDTVNSTNTAGPIWFEVRPIISNNNSTITSAYERQEDCFVCGGWSNNGSAWFATLQPDPEGNVVMVFDYSTDVTYPSVVYTSRRVSYGDSLMNSVGIYLTVGSAFYGQGRWGDYTATSPDLATTTKPAMWFAGQYANGSGNWGTAIGEAAYKVPTDQ